MTRAHYDNKPLKIEAVGNGNYLYRWDIQEETIDRGIIRDGETSSTEKTVQYSCYETTIHGKPEYGKCVEAVIRESYTSNEEIALANKYNGYVMKIHDDSTIVDEYKDFLSFISTVKSMVKEDLGIMTDND